MHTQLIHEIRHNLRHIASYAVSTIKLALRLAAPSRRRAPDAVLAEYDEYWRRFWDVRDLFRRDLPFLRDGVPVELSPFEAKQQSIIPVLDDLIRQHGFKRVIEVGSGAGLNLLFLAARHPDVQFVGLEPTSSGVEMTRELAADPPPEFAEAHAAGALKNIEVIQGSILDSAMVPRLAGYDAQLIFTSAALEQVHNQIDRAFDNIFAAAPSAHFLFNEEWREANLNHRHYRTLVDSDYFRVSWHHLDGRSDVEVVARRVLSVQPSWLTYATVHARGTAAHEAALRTAAT